MSSPKSKHWKFAHRARNIQNKTVRQKGTQKSISYLA